MSWLIFVAKAIGVLTPIVEETIANAIKSGEVSDAELDDLLALVSAAEQRGDAQLAKYAAVRQALIDEGHLEA